jgi:hypothetical protein
MKKGLAKYNLTGSLCWRRLVVAGLFTSLLTLSLVGCGGGGGGGPSLPPVEPLSITIEPLTVSGVAATGAPMMGGNVYLKEANGTEHGAYPINPDGSYLIDVTGFNNPPFYLMACDGQNCLYSVAMGPGIANINPLTNLAIAAAAGVNNPADVYDNLLNIPQENLDQAINDILDMLAPLLNHPDYNANINFLTDPFTADGTGLDKVFDDVKVKMVSGIVTFTGKSKNYLLAKAVINNLNQIYPLTQTEVDALLTQNTVSALGSGFKESLDGFRASMSIYVDSSSPGTSWLKYSFKRTYLLSTEVIGASVSATDETATIATIVGIGDVNGEAGYTFTAVVKDEDPDSMGIEIRRPDGSLYDTMYPTSTYTDPQIINGGNYRVY